MKCAQESGVMCECKRESRSACVGRWGRGWEQRGAALAGVYGRGLLGELCLDRWVSFAVLPGWDTPMAEWKGLESGLCSSLQPANDQGSLDLGKVKTQVQPADHMGVGVCVLGTVP